MRVMAPPSSRKWHAASVQMAATANPALLNIIRHESEWLGYIAAALTTSFIRAAGNQDDPLAQYQRDLADHVRDFHCGAALWLPTASSSGSWPMIVANTVTFGLAATILGLKLRYG